MTKVDSVNAGLAPVKRFAMSSGTAGRSGRPVWLKLLIAFAVVVALFNVGVYVYGLALPDTWGVRESIVIAAPPERIYPLLATPKRWPDWTAWNVERDPSAEYSFEGPETGEGAAISWRGDLLGVGRVSVTAVSPNSSVAYTLRLGGNEFSDNGNLRLERTAGGTRVVWTDGGEVSGTVGRLFRERLEQAVGLDFAAGLKRLKSIVEEGSRPGTSTDSRTSATVEDISHR